MTLTLEQLKARRRVIVKRNAARKIRETWKRKQGRKPADDTPVDEYGGVPESEAMLDELPESLVG